MERMYILIIHLIILTKYTIIQQSNKQLEKKEMESWTIMVGNKGKRGQLHLKGYDDYLIVIVLHLTPVASLN